MTDTWRFIIVVALVVVVGGLLPFAVDASILSTLSPILPQGGGHG